MNRSDTPPSNRTLLLVEDDAELATLIRDFLSKFEFDIHVVSDGIEAEKQIIDEQPDLVILDIMLPGQSGMEICKRVRPKYNGLILMQTALDEDIDQVMGLELGADDYITKQIQPRLLLSRIRALLRRLDRRPPPANNRQASHTAHHQLNIGDLSIDLSTRNVSLKQQDIALTTAEFELLCLLANTPGQVVTRDDIIQQVRGYEYDGLDRAIDRRISRLRRKLQDDPAHPVLIKTIRGKGYQLCL